uniref:Uncharacterized protein n=1 Tax=Rhizophora mucronata TaxID=61149 RepID=A0A2P2PFN1_RHIMU
MCMCTYLCYVHTDDSFLCFGMFPCDSCSVSPFVQTRGRMVLHVFSLHSALFFNASN